jgi:branched-chain amino acid transport system substrate-binding protein
VNDTGDSTLFAGDQAEKYLPQIGPPLLALCGTKGPHAADLCAAVELALTDSNNPVATRFYDDERSANRAKQIAEAVAAAGTKYVIGHFSSQAALSASRIYGRNEIVFLAPGTSAPALCSDASPTTLQVFGTDDEQLDCLISAAKRLSRSVIVLAQAQTYGSELARRLFPLLTAHCERLAVLYFDKPPPPTLPLNVRVDDVLLILGAHEFANKLLCGPLKSTICSRVLLSDDCFTATLFSDPDVAARCSIAFLEESSETIVDQKLGDLRKRATKLLGRVPGPYFETSYIATRALAAAWQAVGADSPLAVLNNLLDGAWHSPFGLLKFSTDRRLQGHRWGMVSAQSISSRHHPLAPAKSTSGHGTGPPTV